MADLAPERVSAFVARVSPSASDPHAVLRAFSLAVAATPSAAGDLTPTLTGLLILGRNPQWFVPQAFTKIARHSGSTPVASVIDTDEIVGTVPEQIERLEPAFTRFLQTAASVRGLTRRERPEYPPDAIRELVTNALVHRDYAVGTGPVIIRLFSNRVEISNPGQVNARTFDQLATSPPTLQNPTLARSLRALGYVESLGVGLAHAAAQLRAAGHGAP
ncbi:MAG TPA: ATP-binding protein, partial [Chloroflexota bacterium]|nr:ATP-binding protein [Chloroflexota bacterium]